jgi:hypothetical protein
MLIMTALDECLKMIRDYSTTIDRSEVVRFHQWDICEVFETMMCTHNSMCLTSLDDIVFPLADNRVVLLQEQEKVILLNSTHSLLRKSWWSIASITLSMISHSMGFHVHEHSKEFLSVELWLESSAITTLPAREGHPHQVWGQKLDRCHQ